MDEVGEDMLIRIVRVQISSHVAIKDLVSTDSSGMASPKRYDFLGGAQTGGQLTYNWWHGTNRWDSFTSRIHNVGLATTLFHNCNISKNANFLWEFLLHFINMLKIFQVYSSLLAQWLRQTSYYVEKI